MRTRLHRSVYRLLAAAAVSTALTACAEVAGDEDGIAIRHTVHQPAAADLKAQQHCEQFGKKAVKVRVGPIEPGPLAVQTRLAEYECVPAG